MNNNPIVFITHQFKIGGVESVFINIASYLNTQIYLLPIYQNYDELMIKKIPKNVSFINMGIKNKKTGIISVIYSLLKIILILRRDRIFKNAVLVNFSDTLSSLLVAV